MNFRISNKSVDEMLFSFFFFFFLKEKDFLARRLNFHDSVVYLKLEYQVVASDVATCFNIPVRSKGFITVQE
jgi:hypothetical protein